jgi:hypothetical protein
VAFEQTGLFVCLFVSGLSYGMVLSALNSTSDAWILLTSPLVLIHISSKGTSYLYPNQPLALLFFIMFFSMRPNMIWNDLFVYLCNICCNCNLSTLKVGTYIADA